MTLHRVRAVNTAPQSENKIHDDRVAAEYGFRGGLVPGVTIYGYMTLPVLDHFGEEWLDRGAITVRLKAPVYDGDELAIEAHALNDGRLEITLDGARAVAIAWLEPDHRTTELRDYPTRPIPLETYRPDASYETLAKGTVLGTLQKTLNLEESRTSAPLPSAIGDARAAHPAILLNLSNELLLRNVKLGPWVHASSEVTNFSMARDGEAVTVHGIVVEKYERKGREFVVLDVVVRVAERLVQSVRHTAIWRL